MIALVIYAYASFTSSWGPGPTIAHEFEKQCECKVELVNAGDGGAIVSRLKLEGDKTEADVVIGRVLTAASARQTGLGKELMARTLAAVAARWGQVPIRLYAQKYVERFYAGFGFVRAGEDYLEDDIVHLPMARSEDRGE